VYHSTVKTDVLNQAFHRYSAAALIALIFVVGAVPAQAARDADTARVTVTVERVDSVHWEATVALVNHQVLAAITLPFRWTTPGFMIDSANYAGTRVEYFALKTYLVDSTDNNVLIGLIPDLGMGLPMLEPGDGPITTLHFTGPSQPDGPLILDSTFIRPHNTLQLVTPDVRAITPVLEIETVSTTP